MGRQPQRLPALTHQPAAGRSAEGAQPCSDSGGGPWSSMPVISCVMEPALHVVGTTYVQQVFAPVPTTTARANDRPLGSMDRSIGGVWAVRGRASGRYRAGMIDGSLIGGVWAVRVRASGRPRGRRRHSAASGNSSLRRFPRDTSTGSKLTVGSASTTTLYVPGGTLTGAPPTVPAGRPARTCSRCAWHTAPKVVQGCCIFGGASRRGSRARRAPGRSRRVRSGAAGTPGSLESRCGRVYHRDTRSSQEEGGTCHLILFERRPHP